MCAEGRPDVTDLGIRFFKGRYSDAYLFGYEVQQGMSLVIWRGSHVVELSELPGEDASGFLMEVITVGRLLETHFKPVKMNYHFLGNARPHLHARVVPRYSRDPAPGTDFPFPTMQMPAIPQERLLQERDALRRLVHYGQRGKGGNANGGTK